MVFLSFIVFGLLSSSLLLYSQRFGRYVLRPSSGICRTGEPTQNFETRHLYNPRGSLILIPLTITYHLYLVMVNGIRISDPRGLYKWRVSMFRVGSPVRQTPEEGRRTYRSKCREYNNKDEDNSPKTLNYENHQASSQRFRHLTNYIRTNQNLPKRMRCTKFSKTFGYKLII